MPDAVVIRTKTGAEYEVESVAVAEKAHPDAAIVRFARTGEPYEAGAKASPPAVAPVVMEAGGELRPWSEEEEAPAPTRTAAAESKAAKKGKG